MLLGVYEGFNTSWMYGGLNASQGVRGAQLLFEGRGMNVECKQKSQSQFLRYELELGLMAVY